MSSEKEKDDQPPYVVAIIKPRPEDVNKPARPTSKYDPKTLRAKANDLLENPNISSHGRSVLKELLGPDEEPPKITAMKIPKPLPRDGTDRDE